MDPEDAYCNNCDRLESKVDKLTDRYDQLLGEYEKASAYEAALFDFIRNWERMVFEVTLENRYALKKWLADNIHNPYIVLPFKEFAFSDKNDAMLFKLTWIGT